MDIDLQAVVQLHDDFIMERINDEIAVYHPTIATSLYLNACGAVIWELCDGKRTVNEIIELLSGYYQENRERMEQDVLTTISQLVQHDIAKLR